MKAHPVRTIILAVLTMTQIICLLTGAALVLSMRQELKLAEARLGADILVYPTQAMSKIPKDGLLMQGTPVMIYKSRSMLSRLADCEDISAVSYQVYITDRSDEAHLIRITAYDPESDFVITPWIAEGQSFIPPQGSVIVGSSVPLRDKQSLMLFQKTCPISGHLLPTGSELDELVFVSMDTLAGLIRAASDAGDQLYEKIDPENMWSAALIRVNDKQNVESVTNWINIYVRKVTAIRSEATLTATAADIQDQVKQILIISSAAWLVLLLALWIIQSMLMKERRKELFVWRSVGASRAKIEQVILAEAFWTHLAGAAAGVLFTGLLLLIFKDRLIPNAVLPPADMISTAPFAVLLSLAVGCISAWLSVRNTLRSLTGQMLVSF